MFITITSTEDFCPQACWAGDEFAFYESISLIKLYLYSVFYTEDGLRGGGELYRNPESELRASGTSINTPTLNAKIICKNSEIAAVVHPNVRQRCSCLHGKATCPSRIGAFQTVGQNSFLSREKPTASSLCTLKPSSIRNRGLARRHSGGTSEA